jgi:hypothetical protein
MAKANVVDKKVMMSHRDIIKYQLITQCFINNVQTSDSELDCLTLLGAYGECELADFCNTAVDEGIFKTSQTVRNFLTKAEKSKLVLKMGTSRKKIQLNPELNVQTKGNIVLDYKIYYIVTEES